MRKANELKNKTARECRAAHELNGAYSLTAAQYARENGASAEVVAELTKGDADFRAACDADAADDIKAYDAD